MKVIYISQTARGQKGFYIYKKAKQSEKKKTERHRLVRDRERERDQERIGSGQKDFQEIPATRVHGIIQAIELRVLLSFSSLSHSHPKLSHSQSPLIQFPFFLFFFPLLHLGKDIISTFNTCQKNKIK